jgi:hypothetical protein
MVVVILTLKLLAVIMMDFNIPNNKNIYNFPTEKIDNTQLLKATRN